MKIIIKFSLMILLLCVLIVITNVEIVKAVHNDSYETKADVGFYGEYPSVLLENETSDGNRYDNHKFRKQLPHTGENESIKIIILGALLIASISFFQYKKNVIY